MANACPLYEIAILEDATLYYCEICSGTYSALLGPHNLGFGDCTNPQFPPCFVTGGVSESASGGDDDVPVFVSDEFADKGLPGYQRTCKVIGGASEAGRPLRFNVEHEGATKSIMATMVENNGMVFAYGCEVPRDPSLPLRECKWDRSFAGWVNVGSLTIRIVVCADRTP